MQLGRRTGMCGEKMMQAGAVRCRGLSDGERQPTHRLPFPEGWMTAIWFKRCAWVGLQYARACTAIQSIENNNTVHSCSQPTRKLVGHDLGHGL
jgi:hypothetical protein